MSARKALLVGSSGGHLAQLAVLRPWWAELDRCWVTFEGHQARSVLGDERHYWAHSPTTRNIPNLLRNARLAWRVLRTEHPDVVVSTGAGVALPFFVLGRLLGVSTVYIEVYDRIDIPTLTGRLVRPFTALFLAQWPEQRRSYPEAVVVGPLL